MPHAYKYKPEYVITLFNLLCFFLSALLVYLLGYRLFDPRVGALSAALFLACELHWQFAISGLSTSWVTLLLLGTFCCLHEALRAQEEDHAISPWLWSMGSAVFLGLGLLSRYSLLWLVLPYLIILGVAFRRRPWLAPVAALVLLSLFLPWLLRNLALTGSPLGQGTLLIGVETAAFPGSTLLRSYRLTPESLIWKDTLRKLFHGTHYGLTDGYRQLGASLGVIFFVASFLHLFRRPRANLLRWFVFLGVITLCLGSSLTKPDPGAIDEANQLVLMGPFIIIFGSAFFFILLDRCEINYALIRTTCFTILVLIQATPLFISMILHEAPAYAYPPYFPPMLTICGTWLSPSEIITSDIPWATAWYGDRTSLWLPTTRKDFFEINDYVSTNAISMLLLSPETADSKLLSAIDKGEWKDWAGIIRRQAVPNNFPLKNIVTVQPNENEYLILADRVRWH
jgi:4-amino-4-deoxy-L-arabinose transferase-like glycosyltransferase